MFKSAAFETLWRLFDVGQDRKSFATDFTRVGGVLVVKIGLATSGGPKRRTCSAGTVSQIAACSVMSEMSVETSE